MTPAPTATDLMLDLLQRWPRVAVDASETPVCVSLLGRPGGEHFFGGSPAAALLRAVEATAPRKTTDPGDLP